jgi:hypothetical protein
MTDTRYQNSETSTGGARGKAGQKLQGAKSSAGDAAQRAAQAIESNPLAVLAGGLAVGIAAGALIPRSERERQALDPVGRRLAEGAVAALAAAKDTGKDRLASSLLNRDVAAESAKQVFGSAVAAAKEATSKPTGAASANAPVAPSVA